MAVNDLWYNKVNCSTNNRAWSFGLWLKETVAISEADDGSIVANALHAHINLLLSGILCVESKYESVESWRRFNGTARPGLVLSDAGTGLRAGVAMSNDNALFINLRQDDENARYNGGIYIGGMPGTDQNDNKWETSFLDTPVKAFTDSLETSVNAVSPASGSWAFAVVSKTFLPALTPIGTPFEVFLATANNRVLTQRRRRQKIVGFSV